MPEEQPITLPTVWADGADVAALYANQLLGKIIPGPGGSADSVALVFGNAEGPNIAGTHEEQIEQLRALHHIEIGVVTKVIVNPQKVREFSILLAQLADRMEGAAP